MPEIQKAIKHAEFDLIRCIPNHEGSLCRTDLTHQNGARTILKHCDETLVWRYTPVILASPRSVQPDWFQQFIAIQPKQRQVKVAGALIAYQHWENPGKPGLVLVHGHAAHAHWWDFIAPAFSQDYDVIALDQSGAGNSEHRDSYSARQFSEEIISCAKKAALLSPTIVGHSFGGSMTRIAAFLHPEAMNSIVIIDAALPRHRGSRTPPPMPNVKTRYYPSEQEGMRRFRLRPPQPACADYLLNYIAARSLKQTDQGYQFKLDGAVFAKMRHEENFPTAWEMMQALKVPAGFIYGEESRFFPEEAVNELRSLIRDDLLVGIPEAYHHVFLDQPLAFISALKAMLPRLRDGSTIP